MTEYEYKNKAITSPFTVVQLSALHSHEFGKANQWLIRKIEDEKPDVIFMTGDMLNDDKESTSSIKFLIRELKEIAQILKTICSILGQKWKGVKGSMAPVTKKVCCQGSCR